MTIFNLSPLTNETFKLDIERMRRGWYSDKYFEYIERPGAARRDLAIDLAPEQTPDGEPNGFLVMLTDTTPESIRRAAEARLAAIVENSDDAIVGLSLDDRVTAWNRGAEQLLGYRADEIDGQAVGVLIPEACRADTELAHRDGVQQGQGATRWESIRLRRDGSLVEVELTLSPIRDADGVVSGFSKLMRDISHRRQAERALADSEARYRAVIEDQTDLISLAGTDGRLTFVNAAYARHFGQQPDEMIGRSLYDLRGRRRARRFL